jgi:hypothetical protein
MMHPLTGSDYVAEQAFAAAVTKAKTEMTAGLDAAAAAAATTAAAAAVEATLDATIDTKVAAATDTKVAAAIAALSLPAVTVADTAPTTPVDGHIWVNTTGDTEVLNVYSGTEWLVVTTTPAT